MKSYYQDKGWDKETAKRIEEESLYLLENNTQYGDWYYDQKTGEFLSDKFFALARQNGFADIWAVPDPILNKCSFFCRLLVWKG